MEKKKLKLKDIEINSFVTNIDDKTKETIYGAADTRQTGLGPCICGPTMLCLTSDFRVELTRCCNPNNTPDRVPLKALIGVTCTFA